MWIGDDDACFRPVYVGTVSGWCVGMVAQFGDQGSQRWLTASIVGRRAEAPAQAAMPVAEQDRHRQRYSAPSGATPAASAAGR